MRKIVFAAIAAAGFAALPAQALPTGEPIATPEPTPAPTPTPAPAPAPSPSPTDDHSH